MMKKTLIAAGVAVAMTVPAIASADVSLTAQLQAEVFNMSGDPRNGANMNGKGFYMGDGIEAGGNINSGNYSRVDLRASHDLGNGLTALAHVAANPNITTGNAFGATREITVGLRGDFGTFRLGRMTTQYATAGKDPFNATFMQARGNGGMIGGTGGLGNGAYLNQAMDYAGKFGIVNVGATMGLDTSADGGSDSNNGEHMFALKVELDLNPVTVWAAHTNADDYRNDAGNNDFTASKVGATFRTGAFAVTGQYETVDQSSAGVDSGIAGDYYLVNGTYRMGANTLMAGYGEFSADLDNNDARWIALGMRHAFTRQVSVHAGARQTQYNNNDDKETAVGAGMRVTF